jgi:glycosyltransferase involved in cell wall biosynthesis
VSTRTSWLIPVRDGERWLRGAVLSALAECAPDDEVVVVDDGSRAPAAAVLPRDPRVRLFEQQPLGIAAALELGRGRCRGELIARLDADDLALPGRMAAQAALFATDPRLAAVGGRARLVAEAGGAAEGMRLYVDWVNGVRDPMRELLVESPLFHPATTIRADALAAVGGWRAGDFPEDYDLWLRLASGGWTLGAVDAEVIEIRDHGARLTRTDARYRRAAFDALKVAYLEKHVLPGRFRVALWCGREGAKPWLGRLVAGGHEVWVVDISGARARGGCPVVAPEALADLDVDLLLVSVGARGARMLIRDWIAAKLPQWREGDDWWALR